MPSLDKIRAMFPGWQATICGFQRGGLRVVLKAEQEGK